MNKHLVNGIGLSLMSLSLVGCSANKAEATKAQVSYQGNYEIVVDGTCIPENNVAKNGNMKLEIIKLSEGGYQAKLPSFEGTAIPHLSQNSLLTDNGLSFLFEAAEKSEQEVKATIKINLEQGYEPSKNLLVTTFNLQRDKDGEVKSMDFVEFYLKNLSLDEELKPKGLCAVKGQVEQAAS